MKHTEKYLQAKWVTENPDGYDERDVIDAKRYCNAYIEGYNQALSIANVVEPKGKFYCKKGTCTEVEQCNHCWNVEHPFNQVMQ